MKRNNIHLIEQHTQLDLIKLSEMEPFHLPSFSYINPEICNTTERLCIVNLPTPPPPLSISIETLKKETQRQLDQGRICGQIQDVSTGKGKSSYYSAMPRARGLKFYYVIADPKVGE